MSRRGASWGKPGSAKYKKNFNAFQQRWRASLMPSLRAERGNTCEACGAVHVLQFAHLSPTGLDGPGRGLVTRYYDIKKNPECYKLLCRDCHREFDKGGTRG